MIANKIIPKLSKAIEKYGVNVKVYKPSLNEFGEDIKDNTLVCNIKGLYSESNNSVNLNIANSGAIKKDMVCKLITLINNDTNNILEGFKVKINNLDFEVINISNSNMINAYYEIVLRRC
jgi:hypothetical protein